MNAKQEKRFFIRTFGCKVNQYETQAMREMLARAGYVESPRDAADVCILNTCTVTDEADKEARYYIHLIRRRNPAARLVVAGCLANRDGAVLAAVPGVTHVIRNEEKAHLVDVLEGRVRLTDHGTLATKDRFSRCSWPSITAFNGRTRAFVKIQDGCENFCSYCTIPYVRGPFRSRPLGPIVDEVTTLVGNGFKEVVLTGICLGAWGRDLFPTAVAETVGVTGAGLIDVLKALDRVPGRFRVRLSSIELKYVTGELVDYMAAHPRLCRHLHIPLQSGDDGILKRMNRPYSASRFAAVVERVRRTIPDAAITTDVMVGFPGETDARFASTVTLLKEIVPLRTHIFSYSRREGTAAARMTDAVAPELAKERRSVLESVTLDLSFMARMSLAHTPAQVLVETKRDRATGLLCGYSDNYMKVRFNGPDAIMGEIVPVAITDVSLRATTGAYERPTAF